jgi:disulfide bond formation protein DsbB
MIKFFMTKISSRQIYTLGFLFSIGLIAFSLYLQFYKGLEPCPLCVVQRFLIIVLGLLCGIGIFFTPVHRLARWSYAGLITLVALIGTGSAMRKVWLEHLPPDKIPPCGPGLQFMLEHLPLPKTIQLLFHGSAECSKVEWQFWGLALSEWTLIAFLVFVGLGIWQIYKKNN